MSTDCIIGEKVVLSMLTSSPSLVIDITRRWQPSDNPAELEEGLNPTRTSEDKIDKIDPQAELVLSSIGHANVNTAGQDMAGRPANAMMTNPTAFEDTSLRYPQTMAKHHHLAQTSIIQLAGGTTVPYGQKKLSKNNTPGMPAPTRTGTGSAFTRSHTFKDSLSHSCRFCAHENGQHHNSVYR
jgi:hypothetical protein